MSGVELTIVSSIASWRRVGVQDLGLEDHDLNYGFIRDKIRQLDAQEAQGLSPRERTLYNFGRRIEKRAQLQQTFWEQSELGVEESAEISKFASLIKTATGGGGHFDERTLLYPLIDSFYKARRAHDVATRSLLDSEQATGSAFGDRKKNLIYWNRGARLLANQIKDIPTVSNDAKWFFETELEALEASRLHLLSPADDRAGAYDLTSELNQLDGAWAYEDQGMAELVTAFELIRAAEYCTLVTHACCGLAIARFSSRDPLDTRIHDILKVLQRLRLYRHNLKYYHIPAQDEIEPINGKYVKGQCPQEWGVFLDIWKQRGIEYRDWLENWSNMLDEIQVRRQ
jgi:hypothetical protein